MNPIGRVFHWLGRAGRLRRRARAVADASARAGLLLQAAELDDVPGGHLEAAVALAEAGRHDASAASWRRAIALEPVLIPRETQVAALLPVLPRVAREVLDGLSRGTPRAGKHWKLERRGGFEGEERWRLEQEAHSTMDELLPTLRYVAVAIAHTAGAPGRVRIDCDRPNDDSEAYLDVVQMGEAVIAWDEARRIASVRVQE
jgi:hypothetical protein